MIFDKKNGMVLVFMGFLLSACSSSPRDDFMKGCAGGNSGAEDLCECTFDRIETHYGEDELEAIMKKQQMPSGFMDRMVEAAEICKASS